jgi:hypothetical protein
MALLFVTAPSPSKLVLHLLQEQEAHKELLFSLGAISQLEGSVRGLDDDDVELCNGAHNVKISTRKRPSAAQTLNLELQKLEKKYYQSELNSTLGSVGLTNGLQSHSLRRGAAQWAASSHKIAVQWVMSRGQWALESLSKAFAYIGKHIFNVPFSKFTLIRNFNVTLYIRYHS